MSHFDAEDWTLLCPFIPKTFAAFIFPYFKKYDSHNMHYSHYICVVFPFENYSSRRITREENKMFFFAFFIRLLEWMGTTNDSHLSALTAHEYTFIWCVVREIFWILVRLICLHLDIIYIFLHPKAFEDNITLAHKLKRAFSLSLSLACRVVSHISCCFHFIQFFFHSSPFSCWCGCYCCFGCT